MHIVLNSYGASIRRENGQFVVATAEQKQVIPPREVKNISISKGARISSDAVLLAIEHEIDVLFIDGVGKPKGRVWSVQYGSISNIRRNQLEFLYSKKAVPWVKNLVVEKINKQIAILFSLQIGLAETDLRRLNKAINSMEDHKQKVRQLNGEVVSDIAAALRGWEGAAARHYFQSISSCLPPSFQFKKRSHHPALDMFNAMLNYSYGILYGKVEGALIKAGIDPYVGIFHRDDYNRPALVFDIIEKYRMWADYVVIQLCQREALNEECFRKEGQNMLLDGLGKRIVIQSMDDYLAEVVPLNGLERSRNVHIQLQAHDLANVFSKTI